MGGTHQSCTLAWAQHRVTATALPLSMVSLFSGHTTEFIVSMVLCKELPLQSIAFS